MMFKSVILGGLSRATLLTKLNSPIGRLSLVHEFKRMATTSASPEGKPRVVLLGTGWSSVYFIRNLNPKRFDLTVVSPRNFFIFTPLLPKVLSGMISSNTASEPMLDFMHRNFKGNSKFIHAKCVDVDTDSNRLTCAPVDQESQTFPVFYDYLVISVGATSNTFGTPGADKYAYFLKEVEDAEIGFQKILENVRMASMPFVSEEEKRRLLHIVVVGGGPTGVESTGELAVLINKYLAKSYPELMPYVNLSIVEGGPRLLPSLLPKTSNYVSRVFNSRNINTHFGKVVCEVKQDSCVLKDRETGTTEEVKCGLVLWASGLKETELVQTLKKKWNLPPNSRALLVDQYLRAVGTNNVFCLGDCCKVVPTQLADNADFVLYITGNHTLNALLRKRKQLGMEFPQLRDSKFNPRSEKFKKGVEEIMANHKEECRESFVEILKLIDRSYVPPFPTAQNAKQEALYLSKMFNSGAVVTNNFKDSAFCEEWKGTLASLGGLKVVMNSPVINFHGGPIPFIIWNGVYLTLFASAKMRASFLFDLMLSFCSTRHLVCKRYKN